MAKDKTRQENISPFPPQVSTRGEHGELILPSLRDYVRIVFRHKWKIILTFLLVSTLGTFVTMSLPNSYQSDARLLIRTDRETLGLDPTREGMVTTTQKNPRTDLTSELEILQSQVLAADVVDRVGVERILNFTQGDTVESVYFEEHDPARVAQGIAVDIVQDMISTATAGNIIKISSTSWNPVLAHDVLTSTIDSYHARHIEVHSSAASPEMFKTKSAEILEQLNAKKEELNAFRDQYSVGSIADQKAASFQRVTSLEIAMSDLRVQISAAEARQRELQAAVDELGSEGGFDASEMENPELAALKDRLLTLQLEEIDMESKWADGNKNLVNMREQIKIVENNIAKVPATVPRVLGTSADPLLAGPVVLLEQARIDSVALKASEKSLSAELEQAVTRLTNLEAHDGEATMLQYEVERLTQSYAGYMKSLDSAEISAALDRDKVGNVSVVQPATMPLGPTGPKRARNIALSIFAGLALGFGLALVLDFLDDTLKSQEEIERRLGLNVLASVSADDFDQCI